MATDINLQNEIITQYQDGLRLNYSPLMQYLELQEWTNTNAKAVTKNVNLENVDFKDLAKIVSPYDTHGKHAKSEVREFIYTPEIYEVLYKTSTQQEGNYFGGAPIYSLANQTMFNDIVMHLTQFMDYELIHGSSLNKGILSYVPTEAPVDISTSDDLLSLIISMKESIEVATGADANNIIFWFSGAGLRRFLVQTVGLVNVRKLVEDEIGSYVNISPNIYNQDAIFAFMPNSLGGFRAPMPMLKSIENLTHNKGTEYLFAKGAVGVDLKKEGALSVKKLNFVTTRSSK